MHDDDRTALTEFSVKKFHELEYVNADPRGHHKILIYKNTNQHIIHLCFFRKDLSLANNKQQMKRIVLFASGSGSNVENIANYFKGRSDVEIVAVYCNNSKAYVLERCKKLDIPSRLFGRKEFYESDVIVNELLHQKVDLIVLAGFLWLIPQDLVKAFPNRMINVHPALLPLYGGKGMYGHYVHEAVVANKDKESGITIHFVNEHYDEGKVIFQGRCTLEPTDTAEEVAKKVHQLEYEHFPAVIDQVLQSL